MNMMKGWEDIYSMKKLCKVYDYEKSSEKGIFEVLNYRVSVFTSFCQPQGYECEESSEGWLRGSFQCKKLRG